MRVASNVECFRSVAAQREKHHCSSQIENPANTAKPHKSASSNKRFPSLPATTAEAELATKSMRHKNKFQKLYKKKKNVNQRVDCVKTSFLGCCATTTTKAPSVTATAKMNDADTSPVDRRRPRHRHSGRSSPSAQSPRVRVRDVVALVLADASASR
jgi:hypothetical protein